MHNTGQPRPEVESMQETRKGSKKEARQRQGKGQKEVNLPDELRSKIGAPGFNYFFPRSSEPAAPPQLHVND